MKSKFPLVIFLSAFMIFLLMQCDEDPTPSLYDPNASPPKPDPVISDVEPDSTFAGIGEVTLIGQNFSNNADEVHVYFDGVKASLMSASMTEINVVAPIVSGDSVTIKVRIDGALMYGEYSPYKLEVAVREYGEINYVSDAYGVACDNDENLYLSLFAGKIIKVTPEEEQQDYLPNAGGFYASLKMGPGGELYGPRQRFMYKIPAGGGEPERVTSRLPIRPIDFDFDANGHIYFCAPGAIYLIQPDMSGAVAVDYPDIDLSTLRVYNGYVYVGGRYGGAGTPDVRTGIWRNQILDAAGNLGTTELVFDMEEYYNTEVGVPGINTITFAEDGYLYIGTDSTSISEAITVVQPTAGGEYLPANASALYDVLITPPATNFCWGTDQYLYVNRRSANDAEKVLLRLTIGKKSAPYYGRQ